MLPAAGWFLRPAIHSGPCRGRCAFAGGRLLRGFLLALLISPLLQAGTVELEWDPNSEPDLAGYNVYRSQTSGSGYSRLNDSPIPVTHYQDDSAQPGVTYYYVVTAINLAGLESGFSNQVSVTLGNPPRAVDDSAVTDEDRSVVVHVLANDSDPEGDALSISRVTQGRHGQVAVDASGQSVRYVPAADFNGSDQFGYTVSDGRGGSDQGSVSVQIRPVNDPPGAVDDQAVTRLETPVTIAVLANDRDIDNDPLSVSEVGSAAHGSAAVNPDQSISYTPDTAYTGTDSFEYTVSDGQGGNAAAQVDVLVRPPNRPPLAVDDAAETDEDTQVVISVLTNDSDPDGDPLSLQAFGSAAGGSLQMQSGNRVLYTPNKDFNGQDSFSYTVGDGEGASAQARVAVAVHPINDPPTVEAGEAQRVGSSAFVRLQGEARDPDGDAISLQWRQRTGPQVSLQGSEDAEAFFRAPAAEEELSLDFELSASDGQKTVSDRVQVVVTPDSPYRLFFPARLPPDSLPGEELFVGVAILNPEETSNEVILAGVSSSGEELAVLPNSVFSAREQRAFLAGQVDPQGGELSTLIAEGRQGEIEGFFLVGNSRQTLLDGIGGTLQESDLLYFPLAQASDEGMTTLFLINPAPDAPANADLFLYDSMGALQQKASLQLQPQGSLTTSLVDLFGEVILEDGYIKMLSSPPLQGFELVSQGSNLAALAAAKSAAAPRLYVPHFFVAGSAGTTRLRLLNTGNEGAFVQVEIFVDGDAAPLSKEIRVAPRSLVVSDLAELLDSPSAPVSGFLELKASAGFLPPRLIGSVEYLGNQGTSFSSLPMIVEPQRELRFLQVVQSSQFGMFTGLAILNPQEEPVRLEIEAYEQLGSSSARVEIELPGRTRLVDLLNGERLFGPQFEQEKGHLQMRSSQPVVAFALFGDFGNRFLAAIEGRKGNPDEP